MLKSKASPMMGDVYGRYFSSTATTEGLPTTTEQTKLALIKVFNQAVPSSLGNAIPEFPAYVGRSVIDDTQEQNTLIYNSRHKMVKHWKDGIMYPGWSFGSKDANGNFSSRGYTKFSPVELSRTKILNSTGVYGSRLIPLAQNRAAATMVPRVKTEMEALVSIIELPELVELLLLLVPLTRKIAKIRTKLFTIDHDWKARKLWTVAHGAAVAGASTNLTYQLAIAPIISDIQTCASLLQSAGTKYMDYLRRYNDVKEHNHHYSESVYQEEDVVYKYTCQWDKGTELKSCFSVKFHAQLSFHLNGPPLSLPSFKKMLYGGDDMDFGTAWELLPLSFLIDYVYKIGQAISLISESQRLSFIKTDYLESIKEEWTVGRHFNDDVHLGVIMKSPVHIMGKYPYSQNRLASGYIRSHYYRYPTGPRYGLVAPKLRVPNTRQALIALSLLLVGR